MACGAAGVTVDFWFDFASTYSYPSALRIREAARSRGVALRWKAFLLGPIFRDRGWSDSPFNLYADQGRYMWRDLERVCRGAQLPFCRPSVFPRNGLLAARVACAYQTADWLPDFVEAVFRANFEQDRDIGDAEVIASCLHPLGLDTEHVLAASLSPDSKARLAAQTEQARAMHLFGAPSFTVDGELYWGNDRLDQALDAAAAVAPAADTAPTVPGAVSTATVEPYCWGADSLGWHLLDTAALSVIEECVPPGGEEVRHLHRKARQFFYVLSGRATLECNGDVHELGPGLGLHIPPGCAHQLFNRGTESVRFLVISAPKAHGDRVPAPGGGV